MTTDILRQEVATAANLVVVKVGTRVLTRPDGTLDESRVGILADEIATLADSGRKVALVSSGAVGAGLGKLGLKARPEDIAHLQAVAAVGQSHLIQAYDRAIQRHRRHAAQLLLTADGLHNRTRYLNIRNTILNLLEYGAIPIINENDTVSVDELQLSFGDNDRLAAMVTNLIRAPLLVLLSDVEGLYDGDPDDPASRVLPTVATIDESVFALARAGPGGLSRGGMASKLRAAQMVTAAGENAIIASGRRAGVLAEIFAGKPVGTLFLAKGQTVKSRKRWIGFARQVRGGLLVDAGARRAIVEQGRSLLPIGVREVRGDFKKGDAVSLCGPDGGEFARGLTNYSAEEVALIKGLKTREIAGLLGHYPYVEVVHRDNLTLAG